MNTNRLKGAIRTNGDNQYDLAAALNITPSRLSMKINMKDGADFTRPEIEKIVNRYHLSADEIYRIFFEQ